MAGVNQGIVGAVQAQFDQLSPRDRRLLAGLLAFFGLLFVVFVAMTLRGRLDDKASRVVAHKETLSAMHELQREYAFAAARIEQAEARLREFGSKPLQAYVEETARRVDATDELAVSRQQSEVVQGVEQTRYKVELRRVPLDAAVQFIYDLETGGYPLRVDAADFKTVTVQGEKFVRVTLELTSYALQGGG